VLLRNGSAFVSTLPIGVGFTPAVAGAIAVVLFLAGVVSGLSGFAFSAVAACVLWLLAPLQAVPLIMLLSACNQLLSLGSLRKEVVLRGTAEREGALAYIAGGLVGAPIGLGLLQTLPPRTFAGGLGLFLIVYSVLFLLKPHRLRIKVSGWKPAVAVGAAGGIIGGFAAFPGSMPVVYLGLRGMSKANTRGVSMNCGRSAGTVENPARPRISAAHIAITIAAEGTAGAELAEFTRAISVCALNA